MNFALDDEQGLIVQTVRKMAERDLRGWAADADRAATPPDKLIPMATDLGFFTDAVPVEVGGMLDSVESYSHLTRALRGYELGRGCAALAALLETNVEPALATAAWGSVTAKDALFKSLTTGGLAAFAHDSRRLIEIKGTSGDLELTGKIGPTPALAGASHVLLATNDRLILAPTAGMAITPIAPSGWRAAKWGTAQLDGFVVDSQFVLSYDPATTAQVLAWARTSLAARAAGVAAAAMEHAKQYASERVQFGQPIGSFESLIRLHDDAVTGAASAKIFALHAAWAIDTKHADAHDLASRARVLAGDVVAKATIDAVQIYGGYGFVNDFPVEKLMRDARAFEALHGDERLGRVLLAKEGQR